MPRVPRTPDHIPRSHGASAGKAQGMRVCAHENHTPTPCTHPKSRRHMGAAHNALTSPLDSPRMCRCHGDPLGADSAQEACTSLSWLAQEPWPLPA